MEQKAFKDNFSQQSDLYVKYRPLYPRELYAYLSSLTNEHQLAWDCGTGNGQSAIGLAEFYDNVIATDPSQQQIQNAISNEKVKYVVEKAENNSIESNSIDLITIANALHWFDFDLFYKEANRVLKSNGIIAAWAYGIPKISTEVDEILNQFHYGTLDDYWLPENRLVEKEYTTIPFPFEEISTSQFYYEKAMNLDGLIGYLNTWSATQRFINKKNYNPTEALFHQLRQVWKDSSSKKILRWDLILKVGKVNRSLEISP